jgi:hypothetical protein
MLACAIPARLLWMLPSAEAFSSNEEGASCRDVHRAPMGAKTKQTKMPVSWNDQQQEVLPTDL